MRFRRGRERARVRRPGAGAIVAGLAVTAIVAVSVALTMRGARGAPPPMTRRFSGSATVVPLPSLLPSPRLPSRVRVAVIRDDAAAGYYDSPRTLDAIVGAWRDVLRA